MNKHTLRSGFTLVEMLVVIAIIGILASVALVSVSGVRSTANDTKRISDLNKIQQQLEVYYTKNGQYPNTTFAGLNTALNATLTDDPKTTAHYKYAYESGGQHYVVQATLENANKILDDPNTIKAAPSGYAGDTLDCTKANKNYCVGN